MSPPPESVRYERKLLPLGIPPEQVLVLVQQHPAGFREAYPPRYVNSVYLDTPALGDFHDHVAGLPRRSKTRIRWYGPLAAVIATPSLERKQKAGHVAWKESHPVPPLTINGTGWAPSIRTYIRQTYLPETIRPVVQLRQPVLLTRYLRRYFISSDRRFRLTMDTDLKFDTVTRTSNHAGLIPSPIPVILELKFPPAAAPHADRITNAFPFRIARCSKYILGLKLAFFDSD